MDASKVTTGQEIAKRSESGGMSIREISAKITAYRKQIAMLAPKHVEVDQLIAIAMLAVQRNPDLQKCTPSSLVSAVLKCAQAGLVPDGEHAVIVSYRNKKAGTREAQFQAMYTGLLRQAYQEERIDTVHAFEVCAEDEFSVELGEAMRITHKPYTKGDRGSIVGAYGIVWLKGASKPIIDYVDFARLNKIRDASRSPVWGLWPERMAKKSGLTSVLKYVPKSRELAMSIALTETSEAGLPQDIDPSVEQAPESTRIDEAVSLAGADTGGTTPTKVKKEAVRIVPRDDHSNEGQSVPQTEYNGPPSKLTPEEITELEAERKAIADSQTDSPGVPFESDAPGEEVQKRRGRKPKKDGNQGQLI